MVEDFLLEIGTEEIPATFILPAIKQMETLLRQNLENARIKHGQIHVFATPRRLAVYTEGVSLKQESKVTINRGPAKEVAFDEQGKPQKAALGFARSKGVEVDDLEIKEFNGREYVVAISTESGRPTVDCLAEIVPGIIRTLSFPKMMRWGEGDFRFARPIHWLVALLGKGVILFKVAGIKSGRVTQGHRFWGKAVELNQPCDYLVSLQENFVMADHRKRRRSILDAAKMLAEKNGGHPVYDEELLDEVIFLVEYPNALCGRFDQTYLELPEEVLITSMKKHQRYFPVKRGQELLPLFISFMSGPSEDLEEVRRGNEKVLKARLEDALFFYREDTAKTLKEHGERLKEITFVKELGSMAQKTDRLINFVGALGRILTWPGEKIARAQQAAELCKTDLVTQMVGEFPELQGYMGQYYGIKEGLPDPVTRAIEEHYRPRFAGDDLPTGELGQILAIADKLDNLGAAFITGQRPSGSQDPLALRRQGLALMRILYHMDSDLNLDCLLDILAEVYRRQGAHLREYKTDIAAFLANRLARFMEEMGFRYDIIDALLAGDYTNIKMGLTKAKALQSIRGNPAFINLVQSYVRATNLLAKSGNMGTGNVEEELLVEDAERVLYRSCTKLNEEADRLEKERKYLELFQYLSQLAEPLDYFFNDVMVMVEDESLKGNRLALLLQVRELLDRGVDLARIVMD